MDNKQNCYTSDNKQDCYIIDKIIYNDFLWIYEIIPYLDPRLFRINELRSVSQRFKKLISDCKHKSKYIKVPSDDFPTLKKAYNYINILIHNFCRQTNSRPPEIWLNEGLINNSIGKIQTPIVIRGMGMDRTILTHGLEFDINKKGRYGFLLNLDIIIDSLSINHLIQSDNPNLYFHGIYGKNELMFINIFSCKIEKCNGSGIHGNNIKVNIRNSVICNNKKCGVHIWHNSILLANDLEIFNCESGILIGNIKSTENSLLNDINIHHNDESGISVGGWDPDPDVIVTGNKTDISYNNLIVKHKYIYGVSTGYSGKLIFKGLDKNVSHDNYNDQNINSRHSSEIIFTS